MIEKFDVFKDDKLNCYQLRTKTNSYAIEFDDKERENIFLNIVSLIKNKNDITLQELKRKIQTKANESKLIEVLKLLDEYHLLSFEISKELKYKKENSVGQYTTEIKQKPDFTLSIFGKGKLTNKIEQQAKFENFKNVNLCLYSDDINIKNEVIKSDFIVVDANEWSPFHIELINKFALEHNKPWLLVGGVEGTTIKIGPLFYGKETGCYNCLISRIKSNHDQPAFFVSYENYLKVNKQSSKPDIIPSSDIIYNIIANLTLLEVVKFIEEWSLPVTWRTVVSFDITSLSTTKHTLLKKPFCEVCKPELEYNPSPWLEAITLK